MTGNDRPPLPSRLAPRIEVTMHGAGAAHANVVPHANDVAVAFINGNMTIQMVGDPARLSILFTDAAGAVDAIQTRGQ